MKRRVYYLAFLKITNVEYPIYQWYTDLIDPNEEEEVKMKIQIEHMKNRIHGAWRWNVPFNIIWKLGNIEFLTYEI